MRSPTANSYHELAAVRVRWRGRPHGSAVVSIFLPYDRELTRGEAIELRQIEYVDDQHEWEVLEKYFRADEVDDDDDEEGSWEYVAKPKPGPTPLPPQPSPYADKYEICKYIAKLPKRSCLSIKELSSIIAFSVKI